MLSRGAGMDKNLRYGWVGLAAVAFLGLAATMMMRPDHPDVADIAKTKRSEALEAARDKGIAVIDQRFSYHSVPDHLRVPFARVIPVAAALHQAGYSHYLFSRLTGYPAELAIFADALIGDEDPYARKLAAYSLGYRTDAELGDFLAIYDRELERERTGDFMQEFHAQSTIEDLVFAAVRLIRDGRQPDTGHAFLTRIVTDMVSDAHYWNSSQYAVASLLHADTGRYGPLFENWSNHIDGQQGDAPLEHSFPIERGWRDAIREGNTGQIYEMFDREETMAEAPDLEPSGEQAIENLLNALKDTDQG